MAVLRSCSKYCRIFALHQLRISPCEFLIPKCGYARGRRKEQFVLPKNMKTSDLRDEPLVVDNESHFIDPDDGERSQSFDDFYNTLGDRGPSVAELQQYAKKEREKLKLKILKKKYFKDPQEHNLLTWETKEQIRFLCQEFPEEWTVEKLAESFPVSKDGIIKILKSSYVIKTPEKILKHDLKVKERWKELEAELSRKGGPIHPQYKMLIESGKLNLMKNADTLTGVPKRILQLEDGVKTETPKIGIFSSILKDNKDNKQNEKKADKKLTEANEFELKKLVETINAQQKNFKDAQESPSDRTSERIERYSTPERPVTDLQEMPRSIRRRLTDETLSTENRSYLETYQMMGTGKVINEESNVKIKKSNMDFAREHEIRKYFKYSSQQYSLPEQNRQSFNNMKHQSWDSSFQTQIKVPENLKLKKGVIYKKNDAYYDENGEILYRVPVKE